MFEVKYPYLPEGRTILYVPEDNQYMQMAKEAARRHSLDTTMPTGAVVVKEGKVVGSGANGSSYHQEHGCERVRLGIPTGQQYELCEGCHPHNHSEQRAVQDAQNHGHDTKGADAYLWGHWWCCKPCWDVMIAGGIKDVYLMEGSEVLFNREVEGNVVGSQFAE